MSNYTYIDVSHNNRKKKHMNRHLIFALILTALLTSCGKEKKQDEKTATIQKQLLWLAHAYGSLAG